MAEFFKECESGKKKGRRLGYSEARHYLSKAAASIWSVGISQTAQEWKTEHIITALKIIVRKQEALQMGIVEQFTGDGNESELCFQPFRNPEAFHFEEITVKNKDAWTDIMMQYKDKPFDYVNGPLWRFIIARVESTRIRKGSDDYQNTDTCESGDSLFELICLVQVDHIIADGICVIDVLNQQFFPILSAVIKGENADDIIPFIPFANSIEDYVLGPGQAMNPVPWYRKLFLDAYRWINRTFRAETETPMYKFKDEALPTLDQPDKASLYMGTRFSVELTDSVIRAAKRHNVSIHLVLLFANSLAFSRTAFAAGVPLPRTFRQLWPIDLRKYADFPEGHPILLATSYGVSEHSSMTQCTLTEFWDNCAQLLRPAYLELMKWNVVWKMKMMKYLVDSAKSSPMVLQELRLAPLLAFSNLGKQVPVDMFQERYGCINSSGRTPLAAFVITERGRFFWTVVRSENTSRRFMEAHMRELECVLREYCQTE